MKTPMLRTILSAAILVAFTSSGCDRPESDEAYRLNLNALRDTWLKDEVEPEGDRLLAVDRLKQQAIVGTLDEVLPHSDQPRVLTVRLVHSPSFSPEPEVALPEVLTRVEEIHFLDSSSPQQPHLLAISEDHRLLRWRGEGSVEVLDEEAYGPISISPSGRYQAYVRGADPLFEVVLRDEKTGASSVASGELRGCWSPAVNDAGDVVFMASASGHAELYQVRAKERGRAPVRRTNLEQGATLPMPTGPSAPLLRGDLLFFEDEQGLHRLSLGRGDLAMEHVLLWPGAREIVWWAEGEVAWAHGDSGLSSLSLDGAGGEQ